jgi:hypothetical protein
MEPREHQTKGRNYCVYLAVSASGPLHSDAFEEKAARWPQEVRLRQLANLNFTTADGDYLHQHWKMPNADSGREQKHLRLVNPTIAEFWASLDEGVEWLATKRNEPDWCGGWLILTFGGHGRPGSGALVLQDGDVTAEDLFEVLIALRDWTDPTRRLKTSLFLDSCYSGAFITTAAELVLGDLNDLIFPYEFWAGAMHDEVAKEIASLGHGLFTYCFSVSPNHFTSYAATAVQPDNSLGPSLSIVQGPEGCRRLSGGTQNPVVIFPVGTHEIDGPGGSFQLQDLADLSASTMRQTLEQHRAEQEGRWPAMASSGDGRLTEEQVRRMFLDFMNDTGV